MGLIQCKNVCKSFGEKVALDRVSVDIPKGKIFGLLGPNGAGTNISCILSGSMVKLVITGACHASVHGFKSR